MGSEVVNGFLSQLGSLGASHTVPFFQFVFCFNWEKSKLEKTLLSIRALSPDFEKKRERSDGEEYWLTTLRDICNEGRQLVDEIDEAQRQVDVNGNMAAKVLCFLSNLPFYSAMACKMKRIRERLNAAAEDYTKFPPLQRKETKETTPQWEQDLVVIGREMDKTAIKTLIKESGYEENVLIIPIIGIGGLGKTTLARLVFNDEEEDKIHFDLKMWVWVSTDFNMETLVKKVIAQAEGAANTAYSDLGMNQLQRSLREKLDGKKYMLVLDDVWETNRLRWTPFRDLLMGGAKGSVILVTTRDKAVGRITSNTGEPYILRDLSKHYSWSLFEQEACKFRRRLLEENLELRTVGEEILENCGGNPLAIKTVGDLLSDKGTHSEWLNVKNQLWELATEDTDILPTLRVSFEHLSYHLQKCFVHCALFPKGYRIEKATLIQLWMAEELIQPSKKRILEDIGEEYFETLLNRNFFEDEEMDVCGNITSCKMHNLMHDLAQTAAGMDNYSIIRNDVDGATISESVIHASISKRLCQFPTSIINAKNLRTFISAVSYYEFQVFKRRTGISKENFANFALTCKSLRVLCLVGFRWRDKYPRGDSKLPNSNVLDPIGKLKQLRYLDLSYSDISTLPNSVCELQNLQTLKLHSCNRLTELPRDIKELKSLRHLENKQCDSLKGIPCGIGQLTCIQTLSLFVLGEGAGLSELETLNNLRGYLEIRIHKSAATSVESRKAYLKGKEYLQTLRLDCCYEDEDAVSLEALQPNPNLNVLEIYEYCGVRFPSWMLKMGNSLPCLVRIELYNCRRCVRFPLFADLPCLEELGLRNLQSLEYIDSYISDSSSSFSSSVKGWFPSLKKVYLQDLPKMKEWIRVVNDGGYAKTEAVAEEPTQHLLSLDSLEKLTISHCPELTSMPLHPNVEELELDDVSRVLIESMKTAATVSPTAASTSLLPSSFTFSKLKSLQIIHCEDLVSLGEGWLGNLTSLEIWNCRELNFSDEDNDMPVLRSLHSLKLRDLPKLAALPKVLQHSTALETLKIEGCPGLMTLPDWFGKLKSLRQLQISICSGLKSPGEGWLENLTSLERLEIWNCRELNLSDEDNAMPVLRILHSLKLWDLPKLAALPKVLQHSTALETLEIGQCPCLMTLPDWFGKLKSLRQLKIANCSELKSLGEGWLENLTSLGRLEIWYCPELNFSDEDNDMPVLRSLHSLVLRGLPKLAALPKVLQHSTALETLEIKECPGLMTLTDCFSKLTSLRKLEIADCSGLKSLGEGWLENLTSLEHLKIWNCPELNFSDEDNDMPVLRSLHSLVLRGLPKLAALSKVLQHSTALETLEIKECPGLMTLTDCFGKLTSLRKLEISDCSGLKSLGEGWLENLTSLEHLKIWNCPELNFSDEDNDMPVLRSLHSLVLRGLPKLAALPKVLQHSTALETLEIKECPGLMTLTDCFGKLTSLRKLEISDCSGLKSLGEGWLENLTSLEHLKIWNCPELNFSDEDNDMPVLRSLHSLVLQGLPKLAALSKVLQHSTALETLEIKECPGLMTLTDCFGKLTSLRKLEISDCSGLKSLGEGWLENLTSLEHLKIWNCPELNFSDEDNDMPVLRSLHSLVLRGLPKLAALPKVLQHSTALETLEIKECPGLMTLTDCFGKLTSLRKLEISDCSGLKSLGEGWLENLTSLELLMIWNCPELNFSDEDNDMPVLRSLHFLQLVGLPKLAALPKVLQHSTALEFLEIKECPGLMTLPDWFGKLTSLSLLKISDCSELKSLPEGMRCLTALQELTIRICPHLSETCRKEMGKDWPKIAHIPMVVIDWKRL